MYRLAQGRRLSIKCVDGASLPGCNERKALTQRRYPLIAGILYALGGVIFDGVTSDVHLKAKTCGRTFLHEFFFKTLQERM
jgi:hypothetical protein